MRMSQWRRDHDDAEETFDALQREQQEKAGRFAELAEQDGPAFFVMGNRNSFHLNRSLQACRDNMVRLLGAQIDERSIA